MIGYLRMVPKVLDHGLDGSFIIFKDRKSIFGIKSKCIIVANEIGTFVQIVLCV